MQLDFAKQRSEKPHGEEYSEPSRNTSKQPANSTRPQQLLRHLPRRLIQLFCCPPRSSVSRHQRLCYYLRCVRDALREITIDRLLNRTVDPIDSLLEFRGCIDNRSSASLDLLSLPFDFGTASLGDGDEAIQRTRNDSSSLVIYSHFPRPLA